MSIRNSKFLSLVLRHDPARIGITLDDAGWTEVATLLAASAAHGVKLTRDELATIDGDTIAGELLSAYMKQIVVDGIFHCDPHPGNILMQDDGRLTLLDFGMVGRFDAEEQDKIIQLLLAFSERQGDRMLGQVIERALEELTRFSVTLEASCRLGGAQGQRGSIEGTFG